MLVRPWKCSISNAPAKEEDREMKHILESPRNRIVVLNGTLLLLFASAWVSDRWPTFTLPSMAAAFVLLIGVAVLFHCLEKDTRRDGAASHDAC